MILRARFFTPTRPITTVTTAMSTLRKLCIPAALCAGLFLPDLALAAPPEDPNVPAGTAGQANASSGSTELGTGDKFSTAQDVGTEGEGEEGEGGEEDPHANDITSFDISAGGIFSTGNSRTLAATGLANFQMRRTIHQFGAQVAGNYGAGGNPDDDGYTTNVANVQGLVRYDVFFAKRWTAFLQTTARHDTFQGLNLRMNVDPGFAFYAINKPNHRLWFEAGYDFQYDLRTDESRLLLDDMGVPVEPNEFDPAIEPFLINHAARLYAGYSNKLSDKISFDTGLEYLQSVIVARRLRLNYLAALNMSLVDRLSIALTFTLRYENDPLPDVQKLDTISSVSLTYSFF